MASDPQLHLVDDELDPHTLRDAGYGGTPLPLVRQLLTTLRDRAGFPTVRLFFEPGSGPAPFCRVARDVWPGCDTIACDVRAREREFAERNTERFFGCSFATAAETLADIEELPDLISTNPPFDQAFEFINLGLELARDVVVLLPDDWFKRTEDAPQRFIDDGLDRALVCQLQIPGRIAFYTGSGTDRVCYSWWHFSLGPDSMWRAYHGWAGRWRTELLPMLPSAQRRWNGCRPGCEQ